MNNKKQNIMTNNLRQLDNEELFLINGGNTPYCSGHNAGAAVREFISDAWDTVTDAWDTVTGWF